MTPAPKPSRWLVPLLALGLAACGGSPGASSSAPLAAAAVTAGGVTVDVVAAQSWQGGFNGAVRVTNASFANPITSFQVAFRLGGAVTIQGTGWNGSISAPDASGNRTARNPDWLQYSPIRAGGSWDVGFTGNGTFAGATIVGLVVNGQTIPLTGPEPRPPTVTLAASATSVLAAASITLTATATDGSGTGIARVEFWEGATFLGADVSAPYTWPVTFSTANQGIHAFTARAIDGAGNTGTSTAVNVTVGIPEIPVAVSLASSATTVTAPTTITLTATVAGVTPARVDFYDGNVLLGYDTTAPYMRAVTLDVPQNGIRTYTARASDGTRTIATSGPVNVSVNILSEPTPPTVTLAASATTVETKGTLLLTATATDDVGVVRVEFYDGTTLLASDGTAPYTHPVALTAANNGIRSYTARAVDTAGLSATSPAVEVLVDIDGEPPTTPTGLTVSTVLATSARLCWNTSGNEWWAYYEIYLDGRFLIERSGDSIGFMCQVLTDLTPATSYTVTVRARDPAGNLSQMSAPLSFTTAPAGPTADVTLTVISNAGQRAISPYVYGYNASRRADAPPGTTYLRIGGNRWTAYNWTNNYSNAGADWGPYSNDTHLGTPAQGPGAAITPTIDDAKANGLAALVTIPIQGWVSQARSGNVPLTDPVASWFVPNLPLKASPFTLTPSPSSSPVFQDELANFIADRWGAGAVPHLSLDNEPDLWGSVANGTGSGTHPEIQRTQLTYADFLEKSVASASAIKGAVPNALVYGPVSYGWNGMLSFQGAPDGTGATIDDSFIDAYLARMSAASVGRRLLDVLDLHWYSEAQSNGCAPAGVRVIDADNSDCVVAARVQAPRSLYDPAFVETSWITQWTTAGSSMGQGIQLLRRFQAKITSKFPGTKLAITEYNHGGEDHVSGAIAQADTLGIFGREGVYAGAFWSISSSRAWAFAAWKAFRNYDGTGRNFGDTSVAATSTDVSHVSAYASVDTASPDRLVMVIVHRPTLGSTGTLDLRSRTVQVNWTHRQPLRTVRAWQLTDGATPTWRAVAVPTPAGDTLTLTLPALSVTTLELTP